jgi:hypothetical protein
MLSDAAAIKHRSNTAHRSNAHPQSAVVLPTRRYWHIMKPVEGTQIRYPIVRFRIAGGFSLARPEPHQKARVSTSVARNVFLRLAIAGILLQPLVLGFNWIPAIAGDGTPENFKIYASHGISHAEFEGGPDTPGGQSRQVETCGVILFCHTAVPAMAPTGMLLSEPSPTTSTKPIRSAGPERVDPDRSAYSERAPPALV